MMRATAAKKGRGKTRKAKYPIKHWSHSSLIAFLRNPLAWHKYYVDDVRDQPRNPASIVGSAGHKALEHFYSGQDKEYAIVKGLEYLRAISDFEIQFGKAKSKRARCAKRDAMEREYFQAIGFYLARPPRHKVVGVEVNGLVQVAGLPLPIKAVSDLVIESKEELGALDIVDHKFVQAFSKSGPIKPLFILQAIFNYYTVSSLFEKPVRRFIIYECKKTKNADGKSQLRRYVINFAQQAKEFEVFHRLIKDATAEITRTRVYLPNPSDMFEGENSFDIYRLSLLDDDA